MTAQLFVEVEANAAMREAGVEGFALMVDVPACGHPEPCHGCRNQAVDTAVREHLETL